MCNLNPTIEALDFIRGLEPKFKHNEKGRFLRTAPGTTMPLDHIPTEEDWGAYKNHHENKWAHDAFIGKTVEELLEWFERSLLVYDVLYHMSPKPFQYYIFALKIILDPERPREDHICCNSASVFLDLILDKLVQEPDTILPVMEDLLPTASYVASNQAQYDASIEIYGSFPSKFTEIRQLYATLQQRPDNNETA